jgi:hypothetical protein
MNRVDQSQGSICRTPHTHHTHNPNVEVPQPFGLWDLKTKNNVSLDNDLKDVTYA